jgi:hypothetical protein
MDKRIYFPWVSKSIFTERKLSRCDREGLRKGSEVYPCMWYATQREVAESDLRLELMEGSWFRVQPRGPIQHLQT